MDVCPDIFFGPLSPLLVVCLLFEPVTLDALGCFSALSLDKVYDL